MNGFARVSIRVATLACLLLVCSGGCGGGGAAGGGTASPPTSVSAGPIGALVEVKVTEKGYEPARVTAAVGKPTTLRITRLTDKTCATELIMKDPPMRKELPLNVAVDVTVTPTVSGEIAFSCAMNMIGGVIDVR